MGLRHPIIQALDWSMRPGNGDEKGSGVWCDRSDGQFNFDTKSLIILGSAPDF